MTEKQMLKVLYGNLVSDRKDHCQVHLLAEHEPMNWLGLIFWLVYYTSIPAALGLIWEIFGDCK